MSQGEESKAGSKSVSAQSSIESQNNAVGLAVLQDANENEAAIARQPDLLQILQQMAREDQLVENLMAMSVNLDSSGTMEESHHPPCFLTDDDSLGEEEQPVAQEGHIELVPQ